MGRRGPAPETAKSLRLRGSWRAKGRADEPQPTISDKPPRAPAWLDKTVKDESRPLALVIEVQSAICNSRSLRPRCDGRSCGVKGPLGTTGLRL